MNKTRILLALSTSLSLSATALFADTYTVTGAISDWNDPVQWGASVMAGNDFVFDGSSNSVELKATSDSFSGSSLTIRGGRLVPGGFDLIQDLIFEDYGIIRSGSSGLVHSGEWVVEGAGVYDMSSSNVTINASFVGGGDFWLSGGSQSKARSMHFSASSFDDFSGTLKVAYDLESGVTENVADKCGTLVFDGDVNAAELSIELGTYDNEGTLVYSRIDLNHSITVAAVSLNGVALAPGAYNFSDFTAEQQQYFVDNGGMLVIAPGGVPRGTIIELSELKSLPVERASRSVS